VSWLPAVVTAAPATEPVTLAEAKTHCRVDGSDSDNELAAMIVGARAFVEDYCGTRLVSQTVVLRCSQWRDLIDLPIAPLISVSSITYLDGAGEEQTLSTEVYEAVLVGLEPHIRLKVGQSFPTVRCASDAIRVTVVAGYAALPAPIRHAMLLLLSDWFDNRAVGSFPDGAKALLSNHRRF
jgi:uncharacterized phiE125 gp8 family phage protein